MNYDRTDRFSKIVLGGFGLLLSIVAYFLSGRDAEVKASFGKLWTEIASIRNSEYAASLELEKLRGESQKWIETVKWNAEYDKDQEQRIRKLEEGCRKP